MVSLSCSLGLARGGVCFGAKSPLFDFQMSWKSASEDDDNNSNDNCMDENGTSSNEERKKLLRRFWGGTVGGIMQALCTHPLETVKARLQCGILPDTYSCIQDVWRREGIRGFYRGVTPQLMLGGVCNSILFSTNQFMLKTLTPEGHSPHADISLWRTVVAAEMTVPIHVLVITPMENVKVKLQVQRNDGVPTARFSGPASCMCYIMRTAGPRGFFRGSVVTSMSCAVGFPFYFGGYQTASQYLSKSAVMMTLSGRDFLIPMLSGCVAGILFWSSCYPFDLIKTRLQAVSPNQTIFQAFTSTYKKGGVPAFYRGFSTCILRSIPANASVWLGIEWTRRTMERSGF